MFSEMNPFLDVVWELTVLLNRALELSVINLAF